MVHHYFGGRKEVDLALVESVGERLVEETLRLPEGRSARARLEDTVSRWLGWAEDTRTMYLGTIAPGEDFHSPGRQTRGGCLRDRAIAVVVEFHDDIGQDSPRLATHWHAGAA